MFFAFTENLPKLAYDILEPQRWYTIFDLSCENRGRWVV